MAAPSYHGWTHRPKSEGGTDPIAFPQAISAVAQAGNRSQTCTGVLPLDFDLVAWNDPSFGYSDVTAGRARYVTISQPGFYKYQGNISWDTDWTVGDFPFIEPSAEIGGAPDALIGVSAVDWNDNGGIIYGQQFTAAESDHHQLAVTVYFNFDPAEVGQSVLGIGVNVRSSATRTKAFGGQIVLTRLGDLLVDQTIA